MINGVGPDDNPPVWALLELEEDDDRCVLGPLVGLGDDVASPGGNKPTAQSGRGGSGCLDEVEVNVLLEDEDDAEDDFKQ